LQELEGLERDLQGSARHPAGGNFKKKQATDYQSTLRKKIKMKKTGGALNNNQWEEAVL